MYSLNLLRTSVEPRTVEPELEFRRPGTMVSLTLCKGHMDARLKESPESNAPLDSHLSHLLVGMVYPSGFGSCTNYTPSKG